MRVTPVKTEIVHAFSCDITQILSNSIRKLEENSVVAITSKIVSLCEGNVAEIKNSDKDSLIENEAELFLPKSENKYDVYLTIKNNILIPNAGVDESNSEGYYVMWPEDPFASANYCRDFLKNRFGLKNIGVIITDSVPAPLKWGVTGISIAHSGFKSPADKVSKEDLFGKKLEMTKINTANALAAAAVLCMGEADEQMPIAVIDDLPFVEFQTNSPAKEEIEAGLINIQEDVFGQLLLSAQWKKRK